MDQLQMERAGELLLRYGPKSVSMDAIAAHLGISKKTIYKEFSSKQEIIERVTAQNVRQFRLDVAQARDQAQNAVHESLLVLEKLVNVTGLVKTGFGAEMSKVFPETWAIIEKEWLGLLREAVTANLDRGIAEGMYRPELDVNFVVQLRLQQIQSMFDGEPAGPRTANIRLEFEKLTDFYLQALCTETGRQFLADLKGLPN